MDCPLDTYAFYRFFPEGWFAIRALLIQEPEHPLGNYLLMLYGRKSASLKPPVPSDTYQNNSLVLKPALEVHINAQILDAVIGFIRTYAIGSVCDLGTIVWVSASDERNTLALRHGLKTPLDSLSVLYRELNLVHQTCELDELGYFFSKPDASSELVTNYQVSHYIFDQLLIFEAMHDLCAQNGYLLHYLPCDGYSEEGLYLYAWPFYESLAETNNYDICQVLLHLPGHEEQMVELVSKSVPFVLSKLTVKGAYLLVLMRKNTETPFVTPFQTVYRKYENQKLYDKG